MKNLNTQKNNIYYINTDYSIRTPSVVLLCQQIRSFELNYGIKFNDTIETYSHKIGYFSMLKDKPSQWDLSTLDVLDIMSANFQMSHSELLDKYHEYFSQSETVVKNVLSKKEKQIKLNKKRKA